MITNGGPLDKTVQNQLNACHARFWARKLVLMPRDSLSFSGIWWSKDPTVHSPTRVVSSISSPVKSNFRHSRRWPSASDTYHYHQGHGSFFFLSLSSPSLYWIVIKMRTCPSFWEKTRVIREICFPAATLRFKNPKRDLHTRPYHTWEGDDEKSENRVGKQRDSKKEKSYRKSDDARLPDRDAGWPEFGETDGEADGLHGWVPSALRSPPDSRRKTTPFFQTPTSTYGQ